MPDYSRVAAEMSILASFLATALPHVHPLRVTTAHPIAFNMKDTQVTVPSLAPLFPRQRVPVTNAEFPELIAMIRLPRCVLRH